MNNMSVPDEITADDVVCPNCGTSIPIGETLVRQIGERAANSAKEILREEREAVLRTKQEVEKARQEVEREKATMETAVEARIAKRLKVEKVLIEEGARKKIQEELTAEMQLLREQGQEKDKRINDLVGQELKLRKERELLEQDKKEIELRVRRQLDEERSRIRESVLKEAADEHRLKDEEKDRKLKDVLRTNEELQRRLEQGSQQLQGETQELNLEERLPLAFPYDIIEPVPKGTRGADILMRIVDKTRGEICGIIAIESKRTKAWSDGWIVKLKEDQREVQAEFGVIITSTMPSDVESFGRKEGVWVSDLESAIGLLTALREQVVQVARAKAASEGKNEKMEILYRYVQGTQFRQRVEAIVESYCEMQAQLNKERSAVAKIWATREKQMQTIASNMAGMYGDFQGLIGASMQTIPLLEMDGEIDDEKPERKLNEAEEIRLEDIPF